MNIYLRKLTFFVLVFMSIHANAMDSRPSSEDHFQFAELNAKLLKIKLREHNLLNEDSENDKIIKSLALEFISRQQETNLMMERSRTFDRFIVSRSFSDAEVCHPDFHQQSLVDFKDGLLYQNGELLTTSDTIWALNPYGIFCIYPSNKPYLLAGRPHANHTLFFQKDDIGLPVACGGHIEVEEGKIKKITNASGHYKISTLQLVLALPYFYERGVLADDLEIEFPFSTRQTSDLHTLLAVANMIEFDASTGG